MNESNHYITSAWYWWESRRWRYNCALIVAGIMAFTCYAAVGSFYADRIPDFEITLFTTAFQAIGYLIMMVITNILYFAGPVSEKLIRPANPVRYRQITFALGYWVSVLLPLAIPVMLLICAIFQPTWWTGNEIP
ncbi:MAG TPA: hypothetical protein PKB02_00080 [Anaerohalosphaeraceae bacterium]|nr:hypothetical protein [Anaerohalosphaeraceae bacterium]